MTLENIEEQLPNGFHDSELKNINLDLNNQILTLTLDVDLSDHDTDTEGSRKAELCIRNLSFFTLVPYLCQTELPLNDKSMKLLISRHSEKGYKFVSTTILGLEKGFPEGNFAKPQISEKDFLNYFTLETYNTVIFPNVWGMVISAELAFLIWICEEVRSTRNKLKTGGRCEKFCAVKVIRSILQ